MANNFKVRNAFIINDENGYWNVFVTGITNDSGLTQDSEYNLVTEWAIKRNISDALLVLNDLSLTGLTDVDFSGLTEGQYIMLSGGTWINVDGAQVQPTYTNPEATPTTVGGVEAGSTFSGVTLQAMWDDLLYPYQHPTVSNLKRNTTPSPPAQSDTTVEIGYTLWSGDTTFTWSYDLKGKPGNVTDNLVIRDLTNSIDLLTGFTIISSPQTPTPTYDIQHTTPTTHTWRLRGQDTSGTDYSETTYLNWWNYFYYGESSHTSLTGTGTWGSAVDGEIVFLENRTLKNSVSLTHRFNDGITYKYYCIPQSFTMTSVKDTSNNFDVGMAGPVENYNSGDDNGIYYDLVSLTNQHAQNVTYKVFRSRYTLDAEVEFKYT